MSIMISSCISYLSFLWYKKMDKSSQILPSGLRALVLGRQVTSKLPGGNSWVGQVKRQGPVTARARRPTQYPNWWYFVWRVYWPDVIQSLKGCWKVICWLRGWSQSALLLGGNCPVWTSRLLRRGETRGIRLHDGTPRRCADGANNIWM